MFQTDVQLNPASAVKIQWHLTPPGWRGSPKWVNLHSPITVSAELQCHIGSAECCTYSIVYWCQIFLGHFEASFTQTSIVSSYDIQRQLLHTTKMCNIQLIVHIKYNQVNPNKVFYQITVKCVCERERAEKAYLLMCSLAAHLCV